MGHLTPTPEQARIIDAYRTGENLVVEARAGTGKTSTLRLLAGARPNTRLLYVAYNRAIANDAKKSFPGNVTCDTAHGLAMKAIGHRFRHRLNGGRLPAWQAAKLLGITGPSKVGDYYLAPEQVARLVMQTVQRFCKTADMEIGSRHTPRKPSMDDPATLAALSAIVVPLARKAWKDLTNAEGQLRFEHDHYLKLWQMSGPVLPYDAILFDEAQDANPVTGSIITRQDRAQLVAVGDRSQAIYGWNGAVDAMSKFPAQTRLSLTQSFRFGTAIAREANKWLDILETTPHVRGFDRIASMLTTCPIPDAVLCRTNSEAMAQAISAIDAGHATAIVGGGKAVRGLAEAAIQLKAGAGTSHPELFMFQTWGEVQDYADNDPGGSDLKVLVKLIDDNGPDVVIDMVDRLVEEDAAHTVISTAHKSKGREWNSVRIAGDFREPAQDPEKPGVQPEIPADMAMLAYVAVTRAKLTLDREGLAWVDNYLPDTATSSARELAAAAH